MIHDKKTNSRNDMTDSVLTDEQKRDFYDFL